MVNRGCVAESTMSTLSCCRARMAPSIEPPMPVPSTMTSYLMLLRSIRLPLPGNSDRKRFRAPLTPHHLPETTPKKAVASFPECSFPSFQLRTDRVHVTDEHIGGFFRRHLQQLRACVIPPRRRILTLLPPAGREWNTREK